jgi:hypothetical protein
MEERNVEVVIKNSNKLASCIGRGEAGEIKVVSFLMLNLLFHIFMYICTKPKHTIVSRPLLAVRPSFMTFLTVLDNYVLLIGPINHASPRTTHALVQKCVKLTVNNVSDTSPTIQ